MYLAHVVHVLRYYAFFAKLFYSLLLLIVFDIVHLFPTLDLKEKTLGTKEIS